MNDKIGFFMGKKGLSPMVSTVIMLVFAIGLGGLVITWGKSNLEVGGKGCASASLGIVSVGGKPLICSTGKSLQATISNDGSTPIAYIKLSLIGSQETYSVRLSQPISPGDAAKASFLIPETFGKIQKALFTPVILAEETELACPKFGAAIESIGDC